jgi:hypothetical protein
MVEFDEERNIRIEDVRDINSLSRCERYLIYYIRKLNYGNLNIVVQGGKPVVIKQTLKTIKLIDIDTNRKE